MAAAGPPLARPAAGGGRSRPPGRRYLARRQHPRRRRHGAQPARLAGPPPRRQKPRRTAAAGVGTRRRAHGGRGADRPQPRRLPLLQPARRRSSRGLLAVLALRQGDPRPRAAGRAPCAAFRRVDDHGLGPQRPHVAAHPRLPAALRGGGPARSRGRRLAVMEFAAGKPGPRRRGRAGRRHDHRHRERLRHAFLFSGGHRPTGRRQGPHRLALRLRPAGRDETRA